MDDATISLTAEERRAVIVALGHVWREVFDKTDRGDGRLIQNVLYKISKTRKW